MENRLLQMQSVWKRYWASLPSFEQLLFALLIVHLSIRFVIGIMTTLVLNEGVGLAISLALKFVYPAAILYGFTRREIWGYTGTLIFLAIDLVSTTGLIAASVLVIGSAATFTHPDMALDTWLRVTVIISVLPCLFLTYRVVQPLYSERKKLRKMSEAGLLSFYTGTARQMYRHWMAREEAKQEQNLNVLSSIYYELRRRNPRLSGLKPLLKEPDDWVRITAARQLLRRDDNSALNTLDEIAAKKSEWSSYAQRMAADWRAGKLKAWK